MGALGRTRLLWKLVAIHVLLLIGLIAAVWMTIDLQAADYFTDLMREYNVSPATLHEMFLDAVHRYLLWVSVLGVVLGAAANWFWVRQILRPLTYMAETAEHIASGDYSQRVPVSSGDEVGHVASSFNRMADSLARIESLRRNLVTDVAHELRTPLTNVQGYLEGLRDGVVAPERATFESLHEETLRLANLVESLLRLANADAAKASLHRESVYLREFLLSIVELFRHRFEGRRISVEIDLDESIGALPVDPDLLRQIVRNLLENAWRYTNEGGALAVRAERRSDRVRVSFDNTGPGIAPDDLPYIFERFYRGEKSRSRDYGGGGIGLAIVRELVEAHQGSLGAESSPQQTTIWFELPL